MDIKRSLSIMLLVFILLIIYGVNATGQDTYEVKEDEMLLGTWINTDYNEKVIPGRLIYEPEGVARSFCAATDTKQGLSWRFTIADKWIDNEETIWYKLLITDMKGGATTSHNDYYHLGKISDSGRVFEYSSSGYDYPTEVNPNNLRYDYRIYYRQE